CRHNLPHEKSGSVSLFDTATGQLLKTFDSPKAVLRVKFTPDNKSFVLFEGDSLSIVSRADYQARRLKFEELPVENKYGILYYASSPDGRPFAAPLDGVGIHIWGLQDEGPPLIVPSVASIRKVVFINDQTLLIATDKSTFKFDLIKREFIDGLPTH